MQLTEPASIYALSEPAGRLRQCEILSDLVQHVVDAKSIGPDEPPIVHLTTHPYAMVLSQDCDLESDYKARQEEPSEQRLLPAVLFAEMTDPETLRGRSTSINAGIFRRIKSNSDERYQILRAVSPEEDALTLGTPDLAIDFKRYFTIPTTEVYRQFEDGNHRRAVLLSPYREHLCSRFFSFQARVALPAEHF